MNRLRNKILAASCFLIAATTLAACTLRFDFTECATDDDCLALESPGVFYTCEAEQCVPDTSLDCRVDGDCGTGETCTDGDCVPEDSENNTNNSMPDMSDMSDNNENDMTDMPVDMAPADSDGDGVPDDMDNCPEVSNEDQTDTDEDGVGDACDDDNRLPCTDNTMCTGETEACIDGLCTELTSADCPQIIGDIESAQSEVFGVILPLSPPYQNLGPPLVKSIELALIETNRGGGLPNGKRVAAVVCDDVGNTMLSQRAAVHLVQNVGAPGIIGPLFSTPFTDVVTQVTRPAGVIAITPAATAPSLTNLSDDGLAFRLLASDVHQAKAIAERVRELAPSGVTIFVKDDAYGNGLFNELSNQLNTFLNSNQRTSVKYLDPATFNFDLAQIQMEFETKIGQAITARANPELAIFIGTSEIINLALGFAGAVIQGGNAPPRLLFSHGAVADMPNVASNSTLGDTLNPITEGVGPSIFNGENFVNYSDRFDATFPGEPNLTISTLTYDTTAVFLFALAAIPDGSDVTGTAMAARIPRIVDKDSGNVIAAGDGDFLSQGFSLLANGENFDYVGASHDVDFDANGDVLHNYLRFINVPDDPSGWTIGTNRVFLLAFNVWIDQCGAEYPPCGMGTTCEPSNGICLPQCDQSAGTCPVAGLVCVEDGDMNGIGICVPPPS